METALARQCRPKWLAVGAERAVVSQEIALDLYELSDVIPNSVHLLVERDDRGIRPLQRATLHTTKALEPSESAALRRDPQACALGSPSTSPEPKSSP